MNNETKLFAEVQRFTQWWVFGLFALLWGVLGMVAWQQLVGGQPVGTHHAPNGVVIFLLFFNLLLTALLFSSRLETELYADRVEIKFIPFQFKPRVFYLEKAEQVFVRTYAPIREFGGWGIRFGLSGRAFNVKGNKGLQLVMHNNSKVLIGTQKPNELQKIIDQIKPNQTNVQ